MGVGALLLPLVRRVFENALLTGTVQEEDCPIALALVCPIWEHELGKNSVVVHREQSGREKKVKKDWKL